MKRAFGYFAMGMAGALAALALQNRFSQHAIIADSSATPHASTPVRYVNLPTAGATPVVAVDFTEAAERSVNAVVHVTTEATVSVRDPFADFFWGYGPEAANQAGKMKQQGKMWVLMPNGYAASRLSQQ